MNLRATLGLLLACLAPLAAAPAAQAATLTTARCDGAVSQPFLRWGDDGPYTLAPGGDFEDAPTDWTFTGAAAVVAGSEPFGATGTVGASSLEIPAGGSALSAPTCIDPTRVTFRFFAQNVTASAAARLIVDVLYQRKDTATLGVLGSGTVAAGGGGWFPTVAFRNPANLSLVSGLELPMVYYRFTAQRGSWQIDDLFVDPYVRG